MEKPVDQFASLFTPIDDIPNLVYAELQRRSSELTTCLLRGGFRSQRGRVELHFDCLCIPSDFTRMLAVANYPALVIAILIVLVAPHVLRIFAFAWLVCGPWAVVAVAKKVLLWRASLAGGSLSVAVMPDALVVRLGSEVASLVVARFRRVLVREFRTPSLTRYAVHLICTTDWIVPVSGWMHRDTAFELGQTLSQTLGLPLTAEYAEPCDMTCCVTPCYGRDFSPYYPSAVSNLKSSRGERSSFGPEGTGLVKREPGA